jgi:hypothetical protein
MSYLWPGILPDSEITFDLDSIDWAPNLAEETYIFPRNIYVTVPTTFNYSQNKIYAQL